MNHRWDLPEPELFAGKLPFVFLVPSPMFKDCGYLCHALNGMGYATFRSEWRREISHAEILGLYSESVKSLRIDPARVILLGLEEGADLLAKNYYQFYSIQPPRAAILLSPTVLPIHLNNFTCPYLVLHGQNDPLFETFSYSRVEEAVHHHQMRYGDQTTNRVLPRLGRSLGDQSIDRYAAEEVAAWVRELDWAPLRPAVA